MKLTKETMQLDDKEPIVIDFTPEEVDQAMKDTFKTKIERWKWRHELLGLQADRLKTTTRIFNIFGMIGLLRYKDRTDWIKDYPEENKKQIRMIDTTPDKKKNKYGFIQCIKCKVWVNPNSLDKHKCSLKSERGNK